MPWTEPADFRETMAATLAKSQEDRRVFELLFDRYFFRAAEAEALRQGIAEQRHQGAGQLDLDELREAVRQAIVDGRDGEMRDLARLAIEAFGRRGEGSGVDRRRRAAHPAHARASRPRRATDGPTARCRPSTARASTSSSATCAASSSAT